LKSIDFTIDFITWIVLLGLHYFDCTTWLALHWFL